MGSLLVVLIILGCVAYQFLKGTLVKSFAAVIISICASVVAFGYFELLAAILIKREILVPWAHSVSFLLLFILAFAGLLTIAVQLARRPIDLGLLPERIGRVICGIFLGLIVSGLLLTAVAMAPISAKYPYQRFDENRPDPENPRKVLLNADGFATGWFSIISSGSFSGKTSFATLHPAFLDEIFLSRHEIDKGIPNITSPKAIEVPMNGVWLAPDSLKGSDGQPIQPQSGYNLTIVQVAMTAQALKAGRIFTLSQLRLICKRENGDRNKLTGKGKNIYPVGYLITANELQMKKLTDRMEIKQSDFIGRTRKIDFAFYVPDGFVPVLIEFKQNCIEQLPPSVTADQASPAVPVTAPPEQENTKDTEEDTTEDTVENTLEVDSMQ